MKARRLQQMALYIAEHKSATMEELQTTFDISMNTVRRDLAELVADGTYASIAANYPDIVNSATLTHSMPLIIDIPDRHGTGRSPHFITDYISQAIGLRL